MYPLKSLFINGITINRMHTISLHASNPHLWGNFVQGHKWRSRSQKKNSKNGVPSKIIIYQPNHKKKLHTNSLHASNQHLRINFVQGHRSSWKSLQKSRKTVYPLKLLFINRITKKCVLSFHARDASQRSAPPCQRSAPPRKFLSMS